MGEMKRVFFLLLIPAALVSAQDRPRTRLEILFDGFMDNMESMATRINDALFSTRSRPPRPHRFQEQPIEHFGPIPEVGSNDIVYDDSNQFTDELPLHHEPSLPQHHPEEFIQHDPHFSQSQATEEFVPHQDLPPNHPHQQFQSRPRFPPRTSGFDLRRFVNRAMDRVRNILPAARRRVLLGAN